ncbi:MAG: hypothetical protein K6F96_04365, partial [Bacteroidales bacterium]|nr:hypothetical protein [Bacteroidales bacterium]
KLILFVIALLAITRMQAQWINDPANNTFIANCANGAAEVRVSTDVTTKDTYVQWLYQGDNGWSPWLQRLNFEGVPQWPANGIHITTPNFATWSPGYAMTAANGSVVSVFRTLGPHHWAVKINADGTFPWGEHGLMLFDGEGGGRSEVLSTYYFNHDNGTWALGTDMDSTFLQYINADGTLRPKTTIKDPAKKCSNGVLLPAENGVFVVYSKHTLQGYTNYNKEIYVAGYNKNGEEIIPETLLFGLQTVGASYIHYAIPDNHGGGYVYQFHNGIGGVYNTYVTHFNENGAPTIFEPDGIAVHSPDYSHYYTNAYATVGLWTNDLIIAYLQKDADSQSQHRIYVNRITETGEKPWGDGILVADYTGQSYSDIRVDANDYASGFVVTYGTGQGTIEAVGYDLEGNLLWSTTMSSTSYNKTISENTAGYHEEQNIVAWINSDDGGVYGQNIGWDGALGEVSPLPPPPVPCCFAPTDFDGAYTYDEQTDVFGVALSWVPGMDIPLHYNLYREQPSKETKEVIEIDAAATSYFDEVAPGDYIYRLTAQFENHETEYAQTLAGEDYLFITVTSTPEIADEKIITITHIYTTSGQLIHHANLEQLSRGVYIIQGLTADENLITRKLIVK